MTILVTQHELNLLQRDRENWSRSEAVAMLHVAKVTSSPSRERWKEDLKVGPRIRTEDKERDSA